MRAATAPRASATHTWWRFGAIASLATGTGAAMSAIHFSATDLIGETPALLFVQVVGGTGALILVALMISRPMSGHLPSRSREWALAVGAALLFVALMTGWAALVHDRPPGFGLYAEQPWWMNLDASQATRREVLVRGWQFGFTSSALALFLATRRRSTTP